jgi:putative membrane protein
MILPTTLIWLHVVGNVFWIGSISAVALLLLQDGIEAATRGKIAASLYLRLAVPAFVLSFLAGMGRLLLDGPLYMKQPWMHAKLTTALIAIALHHVIGAKARKLERDEGTATRSVGPMLAALALAAVLTVFFVTIRLP